MFQGLRARLLLSYLMVMAAILSVFGTGVYVFFSRNLYRQLDKKLLTLAQSAAPSFSDVQTQGGSYLNRVDKVPWRDIFNRDRQSLEWFDAKGTLLGSKGVLKINAAPQIGEATFGEATLLQEKHYVPVRTYTISVFKDSTNPSEPTLEGFIRASQSVGEINTAQNQLFWVLIFGSMMTLVLIGVGGFWLTQKAIEPIEASFLKLKQFTGDASHELRGPLTAIKASVDVMRSHPERIHPKDGKKLSAIADATLQMSQMIEDLLFLARADAGSEFKMPTRDKNIVTFDRIVQNSLVLLEPFAQNKQIKLEADLTENIYILGDQSQLTRLVGNLLENAIHYTPEGGKVNISLQKQSRQAILHVKDTGIGIAPEHQAKVFDRFWRADKARSRREGGTGLGLAIVKAIAQSHGGKISLTSEVNVGSCFQVRLPMSIVSGKQ
jgi:two-component system, OmpR family, manganese sensing sensor histidine kinase